MSTNTSPLQIGSIEVQVVRKPIKNLHLSILPPDGKVRVSSPLHLKDDAIRTLIATRLSWIHKQRARFASQERESPRKYVSGESHYLFGRRYRLEVVIENTTPRVYVKGKNRIVMQVRPNTSVARREELLRDWYRAQLKLVSGELLGKWSAQMGAQVSSYGIKRMKTRWGTCHHETGRIWLNLELAKKPFGCIEYVVVHELLHLRERTHNERFVSLMTEHLPTWRSSKQELNRLILAHEQWSF
jgi:predicted metal-dependent hydrolase